MFSQMLFQNHVKRPAIPERTGTGQERGLLLPGSFVMSSFNLTGNDDDSDDNGGGDDDGGGKRLFFSVL